MKIVKPTLLVDEQKVRRNIQRMAEKATRSKAFFRPHFKTHHSADIGNWFRDYGVDRITVSSVNMAQYFADSGWRDITIAFPYNPLEWTQIDELASGITLNLLMVSPEALAHLNKHVKHPVNYYIKVDVGTNRTGVSPHDERTIKALAKSINPKHLLKGVLAHAGHTYRPLSVREASSDYEKATKDLIQVRETLNQDLIISYGDTPTCSILSEFPEVDELRPGNFAFYDIMQQHFGSCKYEEIGVCMAAPVVAIHPDRNEAVLYGGAVHLSKDFIERDHQRVFGDVVKLDVNSWNPKPVAHLDRLSQEHGIVKGSSEFIQSLRIGDLLGVLPVHSCLTADLQGYYISLTGQRLHKINKANA